jgi:hypothetical protein
MVNIKRDLGEIECGGMEWISQFEVGDKCRVLVNAVMNLQDP